MASATAPGKIILFGEHAVVYGQPAIAAPVSHVRALAEVKATNKPSRLILHDLQTAVTLGVDGDHPLIYAVWQVRDHLGLRELPPLSIEVSSQIPIASGLGSGAAISAAIIRALLRFFEKPAPDELVSDLTYNVEMHFHGTPSGIDNTVVAHEMPVYFVRQEPKNRIETFAVNRPIIILIADTGHRSSTKAVVGDVRRQWEEDAPTFDKLFKQCGSIARSGKRAIEVGNFKTLGALMNRNHTILQKMTVSSAECDTLVSAAQIAGAYGAKLSGAGRGGNIIALVDEQSINDVRTALLLAGAASVIETQLGAGTL